MKTYLIPTCLAALLFWGGCHAEKKQEAAAQNARPETDIISLPTNSPYLDSLATEPAQATQPAKTRMNGRIAWNDDVTVKVFTPFAGRVANVAAQVGQPIKSGDMLAVIVSPDFGQAQADAQKANSDYLLAERSLGRLQDLHEHGAAALKEVLQARADFERARSEKERTAVRLTFYGGSTNAIDQAYALRSPLGGILVEKNISPGQEVRADQMLANAAPFYLPLFIVTDPTRLWVMMDATEQDLPNLKAGQEVIIRSRAYPNREFKGRLDVISDSLDPATHTVRVRASLQNEEKLLKGEMFVSVEVATPKSAGIQVPEKSVFLKGERYYVFREESRGQFRRREVRVGPAQDGRIPVLEGLQTGDKVVSENTLLLEQMMSTPGQGT